MSDNEGIKLLKISTHKHLLEGMCNILSSHELSKIAHIFSIFPRRLWWFIFVYYAYLLSYFKKTFKFPKKALELYMKSDICLYS